MNYILKDKVPVPCDDKDLWEAWFTPEKFEIATYNADPQIIKIIFLGNPVVILDSKRLLFFKVTLFLKAVVIRTTFHATWEEAFARYNDLVLFYTKRFH
jgi:hypothetical protein